jgi:carbon storage regulator CsrA
MRIISRCVHEGLVIGDRVRVTILEIHANHVRLGIETPDQAPCYREEVLYFGGDDGGLAMNAEQAPQSAEPVLPATAL